MNPGNLRIDTERLLSRLDALAQIGAIEGDGVCRLALSDEDRAGRDQVLSWMREAGLAVSVDQIGNVVGLRPGQETGPPVMTGSHIDTVRTGGRFDGTLGVLGGLAVIETLNDAGVKTRRPLAVAFFTNEEGARFAPDMMGSMVHQGHIALDTALSAVGIDGSRVDENLARIGYAGKTPCGFLRAHAYVELHIEQGPVLEREGITIGAVEGVQGISWTQINIEGVANHAGTTPMALRHDAGYAASAIATFARVLARDVGGEQVATVGRLELTPNLVNVVPKRALMTVDLRNTNELLLREAESRLLCYANNVAEREGVSLQHHSLARFEPVAFAPEMVDLVERQATALGYTARRMPSGAGHDAQSFAPNCPTGMIFVPSVGGVSHNVTEYTKPGDIASGANVLLQTLLHLAV